MTPFEIERLAFTKSAIDDWAGRDARRTDWPVVYVLDEGASGPGAVYTARP